MGTERNETQMGWMGRAFSATCTVAVLVAAAAVPTMAAPPTVTNPYPQAGMADQGLCYGISTAMVKASDGSGKGLTDLVSPVTMSLRGVAASSAQAQAGQAGLCLLGPRLGVVSASPTVLAFSSKLVSAGMDCELGTTVSSERALTGKVQWQLDTNGDAEKDAMIQAYIRAVGTDRASGNQAAQNDVMWLTGIVSKGEAVGATISGNAFFAPVFKYKEAQGYYTDQARSTWTIDTPLGPDTAVAVSPGVGYSQLQAYYTGNCGGFGPVLGSPNVTMLLFGLGYTSPLGHTSAGIHFLL
ncbi:MAG: hypothetical protein ACKO2C_10840 [Actinomycetes bacterium]